MPALLAGNAVVVKPDSQTPFTALWARTAAAGGPAGRAVPGGPRARATDRSRDRSTGRLRLLHRVDGHRPQRRRAGRLAVGRGARSNSAARTRCTSRTTRTSNGRRVRRPRLLRQRGPACVSMERLVVHAKSPTSSSTGSCDRVRKHPARRRARLRAPTWAASCRRTSSTRSSQHVDDAVAKGATVLAGGRPRPDVGPLFYEPTVLADVPTEATCYARGDVRARSSSVYRVGVRRRGGQVRQHTRSG